MTPYARDVARIVVALVAMVTLSVVGLLAWGAWSTDDGKAVDELPTVSEVVAAQAHRHGVELPELTEDDRARLSAPPTAASSLTPYDQVLSQLIAVRDAAGVDEAVVILGEVALQSEVVSAECPRLYDAVTEMSRSALPVDQICPDVAEEPNS
jgi:hypothetical protein